MDDKKVLEETGAVLKFLDTRELATLEKQFILETAVGLLRTRISIEAVANYVTKHTR
jgi:hypothetical protein